MDGRNAERARGWVELFVNAKPVYDVCPPSHPRRADVPTLDPAHYSGPALTAEQRAADAAFAETERAIANSFHFNLPAP